MPPLRSVTLVAFTHDDVFLFSNIFLGTVYDSSLYCTGSPRVKPGRAWIRSPHPAGHEEARYIAAAAGSKKEGHDHKVMSFFFGGVGGIRTLGPLLTATRFPVVLVMTTSILLHIGWARQSLVIGDTGGQQKLLYQIFRPRQGLFLKKAEKRLRPAGAGRKCGPGGADVGCTGSPAAPPAGRRSPCLPPCPAGGGRRGGTGPRR